MNVDTRVIYFDVETQRAAQEVIGGWKYPERFGLALAVAYDTHDRSYKSYTEATVADLIELLHTADLIVGFNHLRFDHKVLSAYTTADLQSLPNFDMHAQLWTDERLRVGLDKLGQYTLGRGKTSDGLASIRWWQQGHIDKIEEYCKQDVALTKDLFLHACDKGYLRYKHRGYGQQFDTSHWDEKIKILTGVLSDPFLHQTFTQPVRFVTYSGIYDLSSVKTMRHQVSGRERKTRKVMVLQKSHILFAFSAENMGAVKPYINKRPAVRSLNLQPLTPDEVGIHVNNEILIEVCQKKLRVELITRAGHVLRGYLQHFDPYALYMRIGKEVVVVYWHGLLKFQKGVG